ncbi:MAG: TerC/Alx family metal homeostasis membrane protein [Varibaculum sp.]|nr:TerC/Alx family metal homeostasis membrane protein [Varibaculum sp.]
MEVHVAGWLALFTIVVALLVLDFVGHVRAAHEPKIAEAARWSALYASLAVAFGFLVWAIWGLRYATEYWAGWVTEWSLSLDNLFVFIIIISAFRVPRKYQQKVLLFGIVIALVFRFLFIMVGAFFVARFTWIFYIFGAFLIWTAISQLRQGVTSSDELEAGEYQENTLTRMARKFFPVTEGFVGGAMLVRRQHKTFITPMLIVVIALGSADLMFAVDSIPAIFGLTKEPFIVFAATCFSLLGLRQLYFLIDGLMERLAFLHYGLALILGFIGFKLVLHALHENNLPFLNSGNEIAAQVPEPTIAFSLLYIVAVLFVTAISSLIYSHLRPPQQPDATPEP